jgi:prophage antirepressor-like protein
MSLSTQVYEFGGEKHELVIIEDKTSEIDKFWFLGVLIARILGYKDARKAVATHVNSTYKRPYKTFYERNQLTLSQGESPPPMNHSLQSESMFISEAGLYQLIFAAKTNLADQFRRWVVNVLESIRRTGFYQSPEYKQTVAVKDSQIEKLTEAVLECTRRNERMFDQMNALANRVIDMAEHVVTRPQNEKLLHAIAVYEVGTVEEDDEHRLRCKVLRTQQGRIERAEGQLRRLNPESKLIFKRQPCPNGFNVLNAVKEEMNRRDIHFKAKANEIQVPIDEHTVASLFNCITNRNSN